MMAWELRLRPPPGVFSSVHADLLGLEVPAGGLETALEPSPVFGEKVFYADRDAVDEALRACSGAGRRRNGPRVPLADDAGSLRWVHTRARVERGSLWPGRAGERDDGRCDSRPTGSGGTVARRTDPLPHPRSVPGRFHRRRRGRRGDRLEPGGRGDVRLVPGRGRRTGASQGASSGADEDVLRELLSDPGGPGTLGAEGRACGERWRRHRATGAISPPKFPWSGSKTTGVPFFRLFVRDLSERKAYESQLMRNALFDPLTGLAQPGACSWTA